jgi:hypothetical protein
MVIDGSPRRPRNCWKTVIRAGPGGLGTGSKALLQPDPAIPFAHHLVSVWDAPGATMIRQAFFNSSDHSGENEDARRNCEVKGQNLEPHFRQ